MTGHLGRWEWASEMPMVYSKKPSKDGDCWKKWSGQLKHDPLRAMMDDTFHHRTFQVPKMEESSPI